MHILGAALGWGAQKTKTELGPEAFFKEMSLQKLQDMGVPFKKSGIVYPSITASQGSVEDKEKRALLVKEFVTRLTQKVAHITKHGHFPVVIGGDHAIAMGTWSGVTTALAAEGQFGLIWFDAHMDAHLKETSPSMAYHGMPLARLLGQGRSHLVQLGSQKVKLSPEHVCLVGIRSFEPAEKELLDRLGVRVFYMKEVAQRGIQAVMDDAVQIATTGTKGFGLSIDLDGFDPSEAPATGSLEAGGVGAESALKAFEVLAAHPKFKALEIAEFNPTLPGAYKTLTLIHRILKACQPPSK